MSESQHTALAVLASANMGAGMRGVKQGVAEAAFLPSTLRALRSKKLIQRVRLVTGRYRTPVSFLRPTPKGFSALTG